MNENLNLVEILKDCPKGTKLYSTVLGDVELERVFRDSLTYPIKVEVGALKTDYLFTKDGKMYSDCNCECVLFPSKEERDWSKFKPKQPKFDPKTLQPFDRVLVRDAYFKHWRRQLFSHIIEGEEDYPYFCVCDSFKYCIPYNEDTKHLVVTTEEAPEFYRYWED